MVEQNANALTTTLPQADLALVRAVAAIVESHYGGHPWRIEASHAQGIVKIQLPVLMGPTNWYVIHISSLKGEDGRRKIVRACGEILERYRIPRHSFSLDHFLAARNAIPLQRRAHGLLPT
jgi:hypothetical protein